MQEEIQIHTPFRDLDADGQESLRMALANIEAAHNPFSPTIKVGAVVRTKDGRRYAGANLAVTGQRGSLCAEQVALSAAHMGQDRGNCIEVAVVLRNESIDDNHAGPVALPCGGCLQMINDFAEASGVGGEFRIIGANHDLSRILVTSLSENWRFRYSYVTGTTSTA